MPVDGQSLNSTYVLFVLTTLMLFGLIACTRRRALGKRAMACMCTVGNLVTYGFLAHGQTLKRSILCKGFGVGRGLSLYGGITTASLFSMSIESLGRFRGKSGGLGSDKLPHTSYGLCVVEFLKNK